jgi:DNA-binding SARP family transcriptional activator
MATDDWTAKQASENQAFLRTATELLHAGRYERLAELLHRVQLSYDRKGDTIPAHVMVLAQRICLACNQSQAEADWHQQAREEAAQREEKLRLQLITLLELLSEQEASVVAGEWALVPAPPSAVLRPPVPDSPEPAEPLSLWQRIQGILHWRLGPQPLEPTVSEVAVQEPTPPAIGQAEERALARTEEAGKPSQPPEEETHELPSAAQEPEVPSSSHELPEREAGPVPPSETEKPMEPGPSSLVVYCLGPFRAYQDDHLITDWESLKAKCILKYLVAHHGAPIVKDVLMDVFWPDAEPEAARRNLHQAVYALRKTLRQRRPHFPYVWFEDDCYLLNPDTSAWLDFEQFEQHYRDGQRLEADGRLAEAIEKYGIAEGLYQGDFLEEDLYEDWPTPQRQHLRTLYLQMANRLSEYYVRHGDLAAAIVLCRKILSLDSCYEEAHRRLMQCCLAQGQRHLAVRQYHACAQTLREELDLSPSQETVELYQRINAGV